MWQKLAEVGELHEGVGLTLTRHDALDPLVVLVAGDDGALGVVEAVDPREPEGGEGDVSLLPDAGGDGVAPKEEPSGLNPNSS